ncbi:MAG: aminoacyl-tRNA hydrolase [Acidimicrobiia bacterium]|jgi:ribosome-associated protein|nr:aminoacyl-tRNA hydrolase [Acidimicrobiia bacterium]MBP8179888.1 aminoacyl-tRNA hydrolase [Acidimicrobiia bacterium]
MSDERDIFVRSGFVIPHAELGFMFDTSGGPGGQHANRTQSVVTLRWVPGDSKAGLPAQRERIARKLGNVVELVEGSSRSQFRNRQTVKARLADVVSAALEVPRPRRPTRPTKASERRRLDEKKRRSSIKRQRDQRTYE